MAEDHRSQASRPGGEPGPAELDAATLDRCRTQDPMAFRAFVVRYQRPVFARLARLCGPGPHVDDLAQEVFLKAYRALPRFDAGQAARPSTWLLTIATRTAVDALRAGVRPARPAEATAADSDAGPALATETPERAHGRRQLARALERATAALPEDQRVAFLLFEVEGLSLAEIAATLEIPEATVKTRLFRARERLRQQLGALWEELHG
jgi:RNA polymerase sigma-70 factor (ECF subfamily)